MSGRKKFRDLSEAFLNDPERGAERRERVEELGRAYDALLAGAEAGLSDEELGEIAEVHGLLYDPEVHGAVEEAEAPIDRGEGLSFREAPGEEL